MQHFHTLCTKVTSKAILVLEIERFAQIRKVNILQVLILCCSGMTSLLAHTSKSLTYECDFEERV